MARKANDIELLITAKNESKKAFDGVVQTLEEIEAAAKKGGGLSTLFEGYEKRLSRVSSQQKQFAELIGDTKEIQKAIKSAEKFTAVVKAQEETVARAEKELAGLEGTYSDLEKAANAARSPNEKLGAALAAQESKQASLAVAMADTREQIEKSNKALLENVGLDEKATAAVDKEKAAVLSAGQAWRSTTKAISDAKKELSSLSSQRDSLKTALSGPSKKSALEDELKALKEFIRESSKLQKSGGAGDATKSLTAGAKTRLAEVESLLKSERITQAQLANDLSKTTAEIRRQEQAFEKLTAKASSQKKVYDDLKKSLSAFESSAQAQGTERQQANIDKLNNSLKTLQTNYEITTNKIASTQAALSKSAGPDPKALAQFESLQAKIEGARVAVDQERAELDKLNNELRAAGISTSALAVRQAELDSITTKLTADESRLNKELKELESQAGKSGTRVKETGENILTMGDNTRKSLSYMQRIRGELLAIASTYVGIFAVGGAIKSVYDESVNLNKAQARFSVFFNGDQKKVAEEIDFVTKSAKDLKIEVGSALDQYSKFVSGLDQSQIPLKQIRAVFTGFSTAARVGRLSTEELERVFSAVSQIFGKQQLQTEELKGQLGDALPGAVKRTADALKLGENGVKKLTKALNDGNVSSEAAILLANELYKVYGTQLPVALKGPDAALADFSNTIRDLKLEIANSGFIETLTAALNEATKAIGSGEFRKGAKDIADALGQIIKVAVLLIQNFDKVKIALEILFSLKVLSIVNDFRLTIIGLSTGMVAFSEATAVAIPLVSRLVGGLGIFIGQLTSLPVLIAGLAGFGIGTWLQDEYRPVKKFGVLIVASIDLMVIRLKEGLSKLKAYATSSGEELQKNLEAISRDAALSIQSSVNTIRQTFDEIDQGKQDKNATPGLDPEQAKKDADAIIALYDNVKKEAPKSLFTTGEEDDLIKKALGGMSDKQKDALAKLRTAIGDELAKIDADIQEKSADTLQQRLDSIGVQYEKLARKIEKAGGAKQFPGANDSIEQITAIKQVEEVEKEINKLVQERRTLIANINEKLELGSITVADANEKINATNARILPQMTEALAKAREIAATVNSKPVTQSVDNQSEVVALEQERSKKEELLALEARINKEMEIRRDRIQTINSLVQTGAISEAEAKKEIFAINDATNAQLAESITQAELLAEKLGDVGAIERLKQTNIELTNLKEKIVDAADLNDKFASGLTDGLTAFVKGTETATEAFSNFVSSFLLEIGQAIIKALILKAITGSIGGGSGGIGSFIASSVNHTGGVVGMTSRQRKVPMAAFAGATKMHSGGIAGLKSDEVPTILQKGEEVLTRNDPRHILNNGGGGSSSPQNIKVINQIDSASVVSEGLSSDSGTQAIFNVIRANRRQFRTILGS